MASPAFRDVTILHTQEDKGWCDYVLKHFRNDQLKMRLETLAINTLEYENPPELEVAVRESHVLVLFTTTNLLEFMENKKDWFSPMLNRSDSEVSVSLFVLLALTPMEIQEVCEQNNYTFDPSKTLVINDDGSNVTDVITHIIQQVEIYVDKKAKRDALSRRSSEAGSAVEIIPSSIKQPGERVALLFSEEIQGEVTVIFRHVKGDVRCQLVNPYCAVFEAPDVSDSRISMQINVNGVRYSRHKIKNRVAACQFSSVDLLCETYGVASRDELDKILGDRLFQSLCSDPLAMRMFDRPPEQTGTIDPSQAEYPTMLHWAAANGLSELSSALLSAPGAAAACDISNREGLFPMDMARKNGHFELSDLIDEFIEVAEAADTCGLYVQYCSDLKGTELAQEDLYEQMHFFQPDQSSIYMPMAPPLPPPRPGRKGSVSSIPDLPCPKDFLTLPVSTESLLARGAVGSRSQTELIEIQEEVKNGNFSIKEAEMLFRSWKERYQTGSAVSFKERQQHLKDFKKECEKTMGALKKLNMKKNKKAGAELKSPVNISEPILKRQHFGSSQRQAGAGRGFSTNSSASCQSFDSGRDSTMSTLSRASSSSDDFEYHDPAEAVTDDVAPMRFGSARERPSFKTNRISYKDMYLTLTEEHEAARAESPPPPPIPPRPADSVDSPRRPRVFSRKGSGNSAPTVAPRSRPK